MNDDPCANACPDVATSLKLLSLETGAGREYEYDVDDGLLWVTDYDDAKRCIGKRRFPVGFNPIERIRAKARANDGLSA